MPTTSNFGWTTPADTDLVKDGAAAIRTLGNGIDTSLVDLKGGTTGQVLAKASNTDLDFTWSSVDPLTILDAKGDLITATAADTPARLALGTNNQVLTVDTSTSTGLKWAPAGGVLAFPRLNANYYRYSGLASVAAGGATAVEDTTYYTGIYLPSCTVDRIGLRTGNTWSGTSATVRLGIYNNSTNNLPSTLLLDAGTVSANSVDTGFEITVSQSISAGFYWLALNAQTLTSMTTNSYYSTSGANQFYTAGTSISSSVVVGYTESGVTGAFTTAGTLTAAVNSTPIVFVRFN